MGLRPVDRALQHPQLAGSRTLVRPLLIGHRRLKIGQRPLVIG
jgi:hypothetical protein